MRMKRIGSASEDVLVSLQIVSDLGYAWGPVIDGFTPLMQQGVKDDPSLVGRLRATFLKLSTAMEAPIMRMGQVWPLTHHFLFPICTKLLTFLEGKPITPLGGNTVLFHSSQQPPLDHHGP